MEKMKILWADDEIDLLKPHIMFLDEKGYEVDTVTNGSDALDKVSASHYDVIFLDENMPGLSGLETLSKLKSLQPSTPVVMITKSEEEDIMEEAIGSRISDYLIKPVNPNQILLSVKKNTEDKRLIRERTTSEYQQEFREIGMTIDENLSVEEWKDLYRKLVYWDLELDHSQDQGMLEVMNMQRTEADKLFSRFVSHNYLPWLHGEGEDIPLLSHNLFRKKIAPHLEGTERPVFVVLIDNLRYDQWKVIEPMISEHFRVEEDDLYFSMLPTATMYARNAIFAGMPPLEIKKRFPDQWVEENEEGSKNRFEAEFLEEQLRMLGHRDLKFAYHKITDLDAGKKLVDQFDNLLHNQLNVIVYNFVDMLSHARTDMKVIKELADDEAAYRSLTLSWFEHSPLLAMIRRIAEEGGKMILTTDHGTIRVKDPVKVVGDRNTTTNLRYKQGKSLDYPEKEVFAVENPDEALLPKTNVSSRYIFAREADFLVYPNNYNHYVKLYRDTFQHGGISLEEMVVPIVTLEPKK